MNCPSCGTANPEENKFCRECGCKLVVLCPSCGAESAPDDKFCGKCGMSLSDPPLSAPPPPIALSREGERRNITVFFSDIAGYTSISEMIDPEEMKEILSRIFGGTAQIVAKYEGHIDKFIGDAVMVLFGVSKAHEDDPIRAVRAAMEIHELVGKISGEIEDRIGRPLQMHTGINTGMVVTGNIDLEKGTEQVLGDSINVAARLTGLAKAGEIIVGEETFHLAEGFFHFETLPPATVKGKADAVQVHRLLTLRERPVTIHHLSGLKSELIGRTGEMAQLSQAVARLRKGKGSVVAISGEAGTGKSRLVDDFKSSLDLEAIQWREGYAYAYSQNMPYSQLMDLFSRAWSIDESDPPESVRRKIETGMGALLGDLGSALPYIGSLYSLDYPEIESLDPQFKRTQLTEHVKEILSALCRKGPTIIYLEDLHWADPSSVDLLRAIMTEFQFPAMFLCVYRPQFSFFSSHAVTTMGDGLLQIELKNLSFSETQEMLESLLKTKQIPPGLVRFIQEKVEGYPFYLEEVINTLIESGVLYRDGESWRVRGKIEELDIPTTIHGIITARLDLLEEEPKRIIQEASVIGRAFFYDILHKVSDLRDSVDGCLRSLEMADLIRTRALSPDIEYIFKHALTQEVIYNGILKKERQVLHERVACVIERYFQDRLSEFYETLAFHYGNGLSSGKAIEYLIRSAEKSMQRYAVEEAHLYYQGAFDILKTAGDGTAGTQSPILDLIVAWCFVYYFRGDFRGMHRILVVHESLADSSKDREMAGMFFAWLGFSFYFQDEQQKSYDYARKAEQIGEECGSEKVRAYAAAWIPYPCYELGRYEEGVASAEKGYALAQSIGTDDYLYFKSLAGIGNNSLFLGGGTRMVEIGSELLSHAKDRSNTRCAVVGHICTGYGHSSNGDLPEAIESMKRAVETSIDPFYSQWPRFVLGMYYIWTDQFAEADEAISSVIAYAEEYDCKVFLLACRPVLGAILMDRGEYGKGLRMLESGLAYFKERGRLYWLSFTEYVLGRAFRLIAEGTRRVDLSSAVKNIGFIAANVPFAARKAEEHFLEALKLADETNAVFLAGISYQELGKLHTVKKRPAKAQECLEEAIRLFKSCNAEAYLEETQKLLSVV
jgi:class 3 adenylate cyclase/tetratricopeptide (TPR) repeat protein